MILSTLKGQGYDRYRLPLVVLTVITALSIAFAIGCFEPTTVQIPPPQPVEELYRWLVGEKESNPTRSDARVESEQIFSFVGTITKIEGDSLQFHFEVRYLQKDDYVACKFQNENDVLPLDRGQTVTLYGKLDNVGTVVKFKDCHLY